MNLLQMSLSAGILILAIVVIRSIALNKLPKNIFLVFWGIVVIRLLVPFSIPLPDFNFTTINDVVKIIVPDTNQIIYDNISEPVQEFDYTEIDIESSQIIFPSNNNNSLKTIDESELIIEQSQKSNITFNLNIDYKIIIWIIGVLALICYFTIIYFKSDRELRFSLPIRNNKLISEIISKQKLNRRITIFESDMVTTPIAIGFIKPRIILPKHMNKNDEQLLNYIITHEVCHIKRMDTLWKMIITLVLCIHWFNPMVWVMYILVNRDLEITCDEKVIRQLGLNTKIKTEYAYSLINMAEHRNKLTPIYNGFSKNAVEERVKSIMKYKKTSIIASILSIVMIFGTITAFTINAKVDEKPEEDIKTEDTKEVINDLYEKVKDFLKTELIDNSVKSINQTTNNYTVYGNGYIMSLTWQNFINNTYKDFETIEIELDKTYTVMFYDSIKEYIDNEKIIELIKAEIPKIKENTENYVVERFIITEIIDVSDYTIEELAEKYYNKNNPRNTQYFATLIPHMDNELKLSYLDKTFANNDTSMFSILLYNDNVSQAKIDEFIEKALENNDTSMFSILLYTDNVSQTIIDKLVDKAFANNDTSMFSILLYNGNVSQAKIDKFVDEAFKNDDTSMFSILLYNGNISQAKIDEFIEKALKDKNVSLLSILIYFID